MSPGRFFASSISSPTLFAASAGFARKTKWTSTTLVIGAKARSGSTAIFG